MKNNTQIKNIDKIRRVSDLTKSQEIINMKNDMGINDIKTSELELSEIIGNKTTYKEMLSDIFGKMLVGKTYQCLLII